MRNDGIDILLVEDDPSDAELALRSLRKAKLAPHVAVVKNGAEALDFLFGPADAPHQTILQKPKVICLDLKLPRVSGLEVLEKIKSADSTKLIPVIVMTSSQEERDIVESYMLGANSYIVKPMEFDSFINVVGTVCSYWLLYNQPPY